MEKIVLCEKYSVAAGAAPEETNQRSSSTHNRHSLTKGKFGELHISRLGHFCYIKHYIISSKRDHCVISRNKLILLIFNKVNSIEQSLIL